MMRFLLSPDDWLARHPALCLSLIFALLLVEGALTHA
jgi:hypothetical protein